MKTTKREWNYAVKNFNEVYHTTLNPEGPGVVRIHLVPPLLQDGEFGASCAIINGQDFIPVNRAWSILLTEFIKQVNQYAGKPISEEDNERILSETELSVRKVYPLTGKKRLRQDLYRIMQTFQQIARGEPVEETIDYCTIGEYAPFMRAPHRMDLMVSAMSKNGAWHCNQKCIHCYAAGQPQSDEPELKTEDWKHIIDKCRAAGIAQLTFTGGEPTLREDLVELIDYSKWFITRLNTNGIRITEDFAKALWNASLDSIQITFYSSDRNVHNRLVGAERYDDTLQGIKNALAAGLSLSVNTPLCTLNRDYIKTLELLHQLGVIYVTCSGLITTGNAETEASENLQLDSEELKLILKEAVDYCFTNGMELSFTSPGWIEDSFFSELGISTPTCGACLSNMCITPGGHVVPCQSWLSGEALGDMLHDDWSTIWQGEKCAERRAYSALMDGKCPLRKYREGVENHD